MPKFEFKAIDTVVHRFSSDWNLLDFLKVVRMVFWSGVVGPGFRSLALRARRSYDRASTHCRATRSKARLVSKSRKLCIYLPLGQG